MEPPAPSPTVLPMPDPDPLARSLRAGAATGGEAAEAPPQPARGSILGERPRYGAGAAHGLGGTIHALHDADLDRRVAVKAARSAGEAEAFVNQARILALLEHPGIVPVHDLDRTGDGRPCCTMRLVDGRTLGEAIRGAAGEATPHAWILRLRVICDALAHAHGRGVLHLDVKPDNILLATQGGALLTGWGSARSVAEAAAQPEPVGTPLYLAPEVARGEPATAAADIHAFGATLFHLLLGRPPLRAADEETFWQRRRAGDLDLPSAEERRRVPPALLAIVLHALAADPAARYRSAAAMLRDLDAFLAGGAVSVHRDAAWPRLRAWHRRHAGAVWSTLLLLAAGAAVGWYAYGEHLRHLASWGRPIMAFAFDAASEPPAEFRIISGGFAVQDGALVSTGERDNYASLVRRIEGPVAVEYAARMLPGSAPCDVSLIYALQTPEVGQRHPPAYYLQVGARDNSYAQIMDPERKVVAFNPLRLEPGVTYRVRMEIDGVALRVLVDGRLVCEHRTVVPLDSGWPGLYAYYPGKAYDDLRIYSKGMPESITPLAIGDQYCRDGDWERGAAWFARVAEVHQGRALGEEAAFRAGQALLRLGRDAEAEAAWRPIANGSWRSRIAIAGLEAQLDSQLLKRSDLGQLRGPGRAEGTLRTGGIYALVATRLAELYPTADRELRLRLEDLWSAAVVRAGGPDLADPAAVKDLLQVHDRLFPQRCAAAAASALLALRDYDTLLARHPEHVIPVAEALMRLGRAEEVLTRYPDYRYQVGAALLDMGRIDELRGMQPPSPTRLDHYREQCLVDLAAFDPAAGARQLAESPPALPIGAVHINCLLDRSAQAMLDCEAITNQKPEPLVTAAYLLADGGDALLRRFPHWQSARTLVDYHRLLGGFLAGEPVRLGRIRDPGPDWYQDEQLWLAHLLLRPFIAEAAGEQGAFDRGLQEVASRNRWHFTQRPWHCAQYILGRSDDAAFLAQPRSGNAPPLLALCQALRAERAGDRAAARAAYAAFLALPPHRRCLHQWYRDPVAERFAAWRLQALAQP